MKAARAVVRDCGRVLDLGYNFCDQVAKLIPVQPGKLITLEDARGFRIGDGKTFEVVAVDDKDRTVDIQHFDGTIEELDVDGWREMAAEPIDAPEDWSGSMDVDTEDLPEDEEKHQGFDDPLDFVDDYES